MPSWNNNFPWNFDRFKRWATQFVFDRFESNVPAFKIGNLTSVGNTFKMNIKGQVTYNPHPDAETYVSTGFYLYDTDEETISIMQNKRKKVPSTGNSPLIHQLEELGPRHLSGHHIRPGLRLRATVRFVFRGNQQTTHIFIKEMVPNLYFRLLNISFFQTYRHPLLNDQNLYRNSTYLSHDATKNHFFAYNKYFDPAYAPYNWIEPTKEYMNLMTDFHDSTYITRPLNTIVADFNYCWNKEGCNETNPNQLTVKRDRGFFSTIPTGSGFPLTSFRIKHIYHGYCWENDPTQNNRIILSSRCHDRFTLGRYRFPSHPFALWHVETELRVRTYGHTDGLMQLHSNEDYKAEFISRAGRIIKPISYTRGDCLIAKDERLTIEDNALFHQNTPCDGGDKENATRVKYLPDYSAHYNILNMKNILQTTLPDGSKILLVCDPKRDLKKVSNCHFTMDNGQHWKGLSPSVSQIKFYMPTEDLFYGYCNEVKYHCSWNLLSNRVSYLDEAAYNEKLPDLNMVSATNLDDMSLMIATSVSSEDDTIGLSAHGISTLESGNVWLKVYIWTN